MSESDWIEDRVAELVAEHGAVPPPWFMFPDTHPYDICWRMGAGESHVMVFGAWWSRQKNNFDESQRVDYFRKWPPPPRWLTWMMDVIWDLKPWECEDPESFDYSQYFARVEELGFGTQAEFERRRMIQNGGKLIEPAMNANVASRRCKTSTIEKRFPGARIIDVTSKGVEPWVRFSPFFPHGNIPVPNSPAYTAQSVEGIWQGLKVFESEGVDVSQFAITNMRGIKRSKRGRGRVLGHRFGVDSDVLLPYRDARYKIYLPTYRHILDNNLRPEIGELRGYIAAGDVVLLDYETNTDVANLAKPLSHASLVVAFLNEQWPE